MSIEKLIKCLELSRSEHDGEALTAVRKANNIRNTLGLSWADLIGVGPSPSPRTTPDAPPDISAMLAELSEAEMSAPSREFLDGLAGYFTERGYLTEKQYAALCGTYDRLVAARRGR